MTGYDDLVNPNTALTVAQLGSNALGKFSNPVGALLAYAEGTLAGNEGYDNLDKLAASIGLTRERLKAISTPVRNHIADLDGKAATTTAKFGASTVATIGVGGAVGTVAGSIIPGGHLLGLFAGMGGGYYASGIVDSVVGGPKGDEVAALAAKQATKRKEAILDEGTVFLTLVPQLTEGEKELINNTIAASPTATPKNLSYQYNYLFKEKAKIICGNAFNPDENFCKQIAVAMAERKIPPAILLIDNIFLEKELENISHLTASQPKNGISSNIKDVLDNGSPPTLPMPPRGSKYKGRNTA